ncbi:hypothetical protein FHL15_005458 [Xylaria flabelliformis]|uniref:F-box domain-containing protein n=1 Tax=Xylaria flabelliformis TaxID=2512241 RepID=A0A553I0R8_9PEZI|nr:hypothetical protein FHL15_005458 [Xylaria flabelliformis]
MHNFTGALQDIQPQISRPFILKLPIELCETIVDQLSLQDIKSLGLTCTALAAITRRGRLYGQVVLSRLSQDRDEFEKVVKSHGKYVKEVTWQGLDIEYWAKNRLAWQYLLRKAHSSAVLQDPSLLWIPAKFVDYIYDPIGRVSANWISDQFGSLPNMTTLTIKPMPETRAFGNNVTDGVPPHLNNRGSGDFDFVIALYALSRPGSKVRTLNLHTRFPRGDIWDVPIEGWDVPMEDGDILWEDVDVPIQDSQAFQYLTTIHICAGPVERDYYSPDGTLGRCLQQAKNLRSLKLCFPDVPSKESSRPFTSGNYLEMLFIEANWPHLHSLHLINVLGIYGLGFVKKVRHLTLDDCEVTAASLDRFRKLELYTQLESITIRSRPVYEEFPQILVSEARVLAFLKNQAALGHDTAEGEIVTDTEVSLCTLCSSCTKE